MKQDLELIQIGLDWCNKFYGYSQLTIVDDPDNKNALLYSNNWVRVLRRILDYIKDNSNLVLLYETIRDSGYRQEIKEIILQNLEREGKKRGLLMFLLNSDIYRMLKTEDFNE